MTEFYLRYVNHARVADYLRLGWVPARGETDLASHGYWSTLMRWPHDTPPKEPEVTHAA